MFTILNILLKEISKEFGEDSIVQYYGAISAEQRQENIEKFQDPNSKTKFFIGNPQTGGYGITLNLCQYSSLLF